MPHLDANGLRFHVQRLGGARTGTATGTSSARPAVVMLHGLLVDNLSSWYYTIANPVGMLADTYLYDLRGHGRSEMPRTGYTIDDHVADLEGLLAAWQLDGPVHLVTNSFGGAVALRFAGLHPGRVASLVLVEAHFATEGWGEHMAGSLALAAFGLDEAHFRRWLAESGGRKVRRLAQHSERLLMETSLIEDMQRERPLPRAALAAIGCPTLAIYGEGSDILDRADDLGRFVPRCELRVVPGCTHSVLYEATRDVRRHVTAWIARRSVAIAAVPDDATATAGRAV